MHLALACTARARWRVQGELSPRLAAADSARVGEAGLVRRELAVNGFRVTGHNRESLASSIQAATYTQ